MPLETPKHRNTEIGKRESATAGKLRAEMARIAAGFQVDRM